MFYLRYNSNILDNIVFYIALGGAVTDNGCIDIKSSRLHLLTQLFQIICKTKRSIRFCFFSFQTLRGLSNLRTNLHLGCVATLIQIPRSSCLARTTHGFASLQKRHPHTTLTLTVTVHRQCFQMSLSLLGTVHNRLL